MATLKVCPFQQEVAPLEGLSLLLLKESRGDLVPRSPVYDALCNENAVPKSMRKFDILRLKHIFIMTLV